MKDIPENLKRYKNLFNILLVINVYIIRQNKFKR